jgi:hypothetical protein
VLNSILFLVLLPFATSLLGGLLGLLDHSDRTATLRRIAWRGLPFVVAGLLLGGRVGLPALAAVLTALGLHVTVSLATRLAMRRGWLTNARTPWWDS